jgi:hypothetical protein
MKKSQVMSLSFSSLTHEMEKVKSKKVKGKRAGSQLLFKSGCRLTLAFLLLPFALLSFAFRIPRRQKIIVLRSLM